MPKNKNVDVVNIRFAGTNQQELLEKTKTLSSSLGIVHSELIRNLIAIGLVAYESGAVIGFDGKVVLPFPNAAKADSIPANATKKDVDTDSEVPKKKESLFLS